MFLTHLQEERENRWSQEKPFIRGFLWSIHLFNKFFTELLPCMRHGHRHEPDRHPPACPGLTARETSHVIYYLIGGAESPQEALIQFKMVGNVPVKSEEGGYGGDRRGLGERCRQRRRSRGGPTVGRGLRHARK